MKTLKPGMNTDWPDQMNSVSARGMANVLMDLAKSEGHGGDLKIDPECTINDVCRAAMQQTRDEMFNIKEST